MTQEKLIRYYAQLLEKTRAAYTGDCRKIRYIEYAEAQLEAAKAGLPADQIDGYAAGRVVLPQ